MTTEDVFAIVKANPGSTGVQIYRIMVSRSRTARWFGRDSLLATIFGPGIGSIYVHLAKLECADRITSHWGVASPARGGHRPRHYYPVEQQMSQS